MSLARLVACGLVAFIPVLAHAELDCIVPTREEGFDARQPGAAALQRAVRAVRAVAAIVQANRVFMAGNEPVRVRTSISYYGEAVQSASVITTAYNQKAWTAGCTVSQFADRGGGLAEGGIAIYINDADAHLAGRLGDAELVAHVAPELKGQVGNHPVFGAKGDDRDPRVLISAGGYRPWVPVTVADMLAWRERELARDEAEWHQPRRSERRARRSQDRGDVPKREESESRGGGEDARSDARVAAEDAGRLRAPANRR